MSSLSRAIGADGPTPVTLTNLIAKTRSVAADVTAGLHRVEFNEVDRWSVRLSSDEYTDVWLISWTLDQSTELHDHAGSLGALTVVAGTLTERRWARDASGNAAIHSREMPPAASFGFPLGHVHDVINTREEAAVTVHAYSPPLTAMNYYEVNAAGALRRTRSVLTDIPEPAATPYPATAVLR